jgi:hypothetical protein
MKKKLDDNSVLFSVQRSIQSPDSKGFPLAQVLEIQIEQVHTNGGHWVGKMQTVMLNLTEKSRLCVNIKTLLRNELPTKQYF